MKYNHTHTHTIVVTILQLEEEGWHGLFGHHILAPVELEGCPVKLGRGRFSVPKWDPVPR